MIRRLGRLLVLVVLMGVLGVLGVLHGPVALHAGAPGTEEDVAFVEVVTTKPDVVVHEPIVLRLRIGYDRAHFEAHAVPLFRRAVPIPLQIEAPFLADLPEAVALPRDAPESARTPTNGVHLAVNGEVVQARRLPHPEVREGRSFDVLEIVRVYARDRPGTMTVPAPVLRFALATAFEEDFLGGRVARDRREVVVRGEGLSIEVHPLPEAGRPEGFVDAVGRFAVKASLVEEAAPGDGDLLHVALEIEGEGNLATLTPPGQAAMPGFHVYATRERLRGGRRTVTYEVAPLDDGIVSVPAIALAHYDPAPPGGYRVARTEPLALPHRPPLARADRGAAGARAPPPAGPAQDGEADEGARPRTALLVGALLVGVLLGVLAAGLLARRRRRRAHPVAPPGAPDALAPAMGATRGPSVAPLAAPAPDAPRRVLAAALASRLGVPEAAVIAGDLADRLARSGVARPLALRASAALERLVAARYGGEPVPEAEGLVDDLLRELDGADPPPPPPLS